MNWFQKLKRVMRQIHLVDKCLILFMMVILGQLTLNLLLNSPESREMNNVNTILRTSAAAIFGYFLSANFVKNRYDKSGCKIKEEAQRPAQNLQVLIATITGLFCLVMLTVVSRKQGLFLSSDALATVTQFRDFISGCVGFLIGTPTSGDND